MNRCEDYPCCGHEAGGCPDPDGRFRCARCGGKLPRRATSAVCARCHAHWRRAWANGDEDRCDERDGDLALREGPAAAPAGSRRRRRGVVVPASLLCAEDQGRVLGRTWVQIGADGRMLDGGQRWVPTGAAIGEEGGSGEWAEED